ncbi:MAG TPA: prolyl oligopeptidase family serine peptidase [Steroidobacteraceae bacterium]
MRRLIISIAIAGTGIALLAALPMPPAARKVGVVDRQFGLELPDPYRWMEGANNPEFQSWLKAQGEFTRAQLDSAPGLGEWQKRLTTASGATSLNRLQRRVGGHVFFLRLQGGRQGVLMVRDADGKERVLVDPNSMGGDQPASVTEYSVSPDAKLVAVNLDRGGNEITTVQILDVATGAARADAFERVWGEFPVSWFPDSSAVVYDQLAPPGEAPANDPLQNSRSRFHKLGQPVGDDPVFLAKDVNPRVPLEPQEFSIVDASANSDWAIALISTARAELRACYARRSEAFAAKAPWQCPVTYDHVVQSLDLKGDTLYLLSMKGAPNGQILALDMSRANARFEDARVFLPESADAVITGIWAARDALYVRRMANGLDSLLRVPYAGGEPKKLPLPLTGAMYLVSTQPAEDGVLFTLQNWTTPRVAYVYDPGTNAISDLKLGATSPADYSMITSVETEAVSKDGTRVPLSIVYRNDAKRDGSHLAILDGYGGYGVSEQPYFDPLLLEWVKAGHVYAVAHVRGGGEKGDAWRLGAKGATKYKAVEDFVACAQQLAKLGLTKASRIAASGASAGGILVGGAVTHAPDQFGAAIISVGVLNPVRLLEAINGADQIAELGDPRTPDGLKTLAAMDAYQQIRDHVAYPAILLPVGLNDSRVSTWQTGKFAARMRTATTSGKPVWIRTDAEAGHLGGNLNSQAAEQADIYTFIETNLK